ncbi:MAG: T9SS type A sorting domain-containing protein [Calditrichaeota bacterium]|nr:T9SS type A sorting domain-containing protein [Calditrichota bacterium]
MQLFRRILLFLLISLTGIMAQNSPLQLVGHWANGPSQSVFATDTLAIISRGPGFEILNVSDPTAPVTITQQTFVDIINHIEVVGSRAYITGPKRGLWMYDLSTPANPRVIGFIDSLAVNGLHVSGDTTYLVSVVEGMIIVDITDPTAPTIISTSFPNMGLNDVDLYNQYAIVASTYNGLMVFDVSNPASPTQISTVSGALVRVIVHGNYAYGFTHNGELKVYDLTDPTAPSQVGYYAPGPESAGGLFIDGNYAYLGTQAGLYIVDISDPTNPTKVGTHGGAVNIRDIHVDNGIAYTANYEYARGNYYQFLNIQDPTAPTTLYEKFVGDYVYNVLARGDYAYVAQNMSGIRVLDVSDPTAPREVGALDTSGIAIGLGLADSILYAGITAYGLSIVDVTNPFQPVEMGKLDIWQAYDIKVMGSYAFAACAADGLRIIDVSDPTDPTEVWVIDNSYNTQELAITEDYAFLADGNGGGMIVIDIRNPVDPSEVAVSNSGTAYQGLAKMGNFVYVTGTGYGLHVIDISDPLSPTQVGSFYDANYTYQDVAVDSQFAYVIATEIGSYNPEIWMLSISDPTNPTLEARWRSLPKAREVWVDGDRVYVASDEYGVYILQNALATSITSSETPVASDFQLEQNYPNPFNPATTIGFQLPKRSRVELAIYDLNGRHLRTLVNEILPAGRHAYRWDGTTNQGIPVSSGVYLYRLTIDNQIMLSRKMILLK